MSDNRLPPRAEELVKAFVDFHDRVRYYLEATDHQDNETSEHSTWITQACTPTYNDVETLVKDAESVYTSPIFIRLLYRDNTYKDIREHTVRLVEALEMESPQQVLAELFRHLDKLTAEDRARSFLLLASEVPGSEADEDKVRVGWLDKIVESFEASPRALRPQLLLAASIIGHEPMVTLLLRDIAADNEQAPNINTVEAECLIEAAMNQHLPIVKMLLDGGRFSKINESHWDAVVRALEASCGNGFADITDTLLSHYRSYCSDISACDIHHPRLLRLALSSAHFDLVKLLLECDPRGTLCNLLELVDTLREEVTQETPGLSEEEAGTAPSGFVAIVVGKENDDMDDVEMWDAIALARGVTAENTTLVRFLVNHVDFCREILTAALETAEECGNLDMIEIISSKLQKLVNQYDKDEEEGVGADDMTASSPSTNLVYSRGGSAETQTDNDEEPQPPMDDTDPTTVDDGNAAVVSKVSSNESHPVPDESLEAIHTASFRAVEHVISSARQSVVFKCVGMVSEELGQALAEQLEVEAHVDATAELTIDTMDFPEITTDRIMEKTLNEKPATDCGSPTADVIMPVESSYPCCDQERSTVSVGQEQEKEDGQATHFDELDGVSGESLTSADDSSTVAERVEMQETTDNVDTCENFRGHATASSTSEQDDDEENDTCTIEVQRSEESTMIIPSDHADEFRNDVDVSKGNHVNLAESACAKSPFASDYGKKTDSNSQPHEEVKVQGPRVHAPVSVTSSSTVNPTRSTILCPMKWVELLMDTCEISIPNIDAFAQLCEGNRVKVFYKERPVLFPGTIIRCHPNGVYDVVYEDGVEESCVPHELIQLHVVEPEHTVSCQNDEERASDETHLSSTCTCSRPSSGYSRMDIPNRGSGESRNSAGMSVPVCDPLNHHADRQESSDDADGSIASNTNGVADTEKEAFYYDECSTESIQISPQTALPEDVDQNSYVKASQPTGSSSHDTHPLSNRVDNVLVLENVPEIPSIIVRSKELEQSFTGRKDTENEIRAAIGTAQGRLRDKSSVASLHVRSRCSTADNVSTDEVTEWKNVDLLLNRKRRLFQTQTGSIESTKVPWGEEFATIQSLKRFAVQHPDILRAHIETQLRELDGPLASNSPVKPHIPRIQNASAHSGAGQARESLLLMKDLAFMLQHRLAPFFDAILPVVMSTVFNANKRFLCETATEVLDAIILHCSGRKLAFQLLQLGETYSKYGDLRLYKLASVYVEKCVYNWNKPEFAALHSSQSSTLLLTLLAKSLTSKSAPVQISAQKSLRHLRDELGTRKFETVLRAHVSLDLETLVLKECGYASVRSTTPSRRNTSRRREVGTRTDASSPTIVQSSPNILQRMLLQRQNRVLPTQT